MLRVTGRQTWILVPEILVSSSFANHIDIYNLAGCIFFDPSLRDLKGRMLTPLSFEFLLLVQHTAAYATSNLSLSWLGGALVMKDVLPRAQQPSLSPLKHGMDRIRTRFFAYRSDALNFLSLAPAGTKGRAEGV